MGSELINHDREMYPLSQDFYMYAGCHDSPFLVTGDCYKRQIAWERSIASQETAELRAKRVETPR